MPIRIAVLSIDAGDPGRVADFWAGALGWDAWPDPGGGGVRLAPPGAPEASGALGPTIDVLPVPEGRTVKNRLNFDVRADGSTQAESPVGIFSRSSPARTAVASSRTTGVAVGDRRRSQAFLFP